ncbi:protein-L-isoaspartate(D-aspartate) O-methyltransferase [Negadavirga shengliensis]|uniref:Protein-L-isoaspartate O-methyltransferase n=1 Tax=Negadavirga shengliensis TaxID=1389218 RepID=A0ABV9T8C9_9BACT
MITTKMEMVEYQLKKRGVTDPRVINAMLEVDRDLFVPEELMDRAYEDGPLPIGKGQTISQPYIVGYMAEKLMLDKESTVLEVGTGCGYNAAVLSRIASHIYSVEIIEWLADLARENLSKAGIENVSVRAGNGYDGWPEKAPFDAVVLTAAAAKIPQPLKQQLKVGGRLLAPVGETIQHLILFEKIDQDSFEETEFLPVKFVPMTGESNN